MKKELDKRGSRWYYIEALPRGGCEGEHGKRNLKKLEKSS